VERDRLEPQHRRAKHLKAPGAKGRRGGLIVRMRAGDENGHASDLQKFLRKMFRR
jgi:hypothetical protein